MFYRLSGLRPIRLHVLAVLAVAVTLLGHQAAVAAASNINLYPVDPYLLGQFGDGNKLGNLNLSTLYQKRNWYAVRAEGLVADSTSAAIAVVETNNGTADLTLTANDGAVLLPYEANFLTQAPAAGTATLTIPAASLVKVGSLYFAAVLVQAPPTTTPQSFTALVTITAQQAWRPEAGDDGAQPAAGRAGAWAVGRRDEPQGSERLSARHGALEAVAPG